MEINGKFVRLGESKEGQGANGAWQKQDIIIETFGDRPKNVCISCWGGDAGTARTLAAGQVLSLVVGIESREFNGRWYTDVRLIRFGGQRAARPQPAQYAQAAQPAPLPPVTEQYLNQGGNGDDLPF